MGKFRVQKTGINLKRVNKLGDCDYAAIDKPRRNKERKLFKELHIILSAIVAYRTLLRSHSICNVSPSPSLWYAT